MALRKALGNTVLLLVSLAVCLLLAEGATRLLQKAGKLPEFNRDTLHKGFRKPEETLNAKTIPSDNPVLFHQYDPNDSMVNSVGHRGAEFPLEKTPGSLRIAVLGDSVAYGFGVELEKTFPLQLQSLLQQKGQAAEVLNFAVSGYGTAAHIELFNSKVKQYEPDFVLLAYVLNDPLPNDLIVTVLKELMATGRFFDKLAGRTQFGAWVYLQYYNYKDQQSTHRNYESIFAEDATWQELNQALEYLKEANNGQFAVAVFPLLLDYTRYPFTNIHQRLMDAFEAKDVKAIDMLPIYSEYDHKQLRIHPQDNTHPNAVGHERAAEALADFLLRDVL